MRDKPRIYSLPCVGWRIRLHGFLDLPGGPTLAGAVARAIKHQQAPIARLKRKKK
jgi:hypothetical protein